MALSRQLYGTIPDVMVPEMYVEHTARRVLVMQWVEVFFILYFSLFIPFLWLNLWDWLRQQSYSWLDLAIQQKIWTRLYSCTNTYTSSLWPEELIHNNYFFNQQKYVLVSQCNHAFRCIIYLFMIPYFLILFSRILHQKRNKNP